MSTVSDSIKLLDKNIFTDEILTSFYKFMEDTNTIVLDSGGVDCNQLVEDYFNYVPPFENCDKKRKEFPDAMMAQKLKLEFDASNPLHIICKDGGFSQSFKESSGFTVYNDIKKLYDMINRHDKIYQEVIRYISYETTKQELKSRIQSKIIADNVTVDGNYYLDGEWCCETEYEETEVANVTVNTLEISSVDEITEEKVSLPLLVDAEIRVDCKYLDENNSFWDGEDKEYFYKAIGSLLQRHEDCFDVEITLKITDNDFTVETITPELYLSPDTYKGTDVTPSDRQLTLEEDAKADLIDTLEDRHRH